MDDDSTSGTPNGSRLLEFLKVEYVKDDEVERVSLDKCGWRSLVQIAQGTGLAIRSLYGKKPGDLGTALKQLVKDRLIEIRYLKGERGRGGEVTRFRILTTRNQSLSQHKYETVIRTGSSKGKEAAKEVLESKNLGIVRPDKNRIAVLPFANISPEPKDEYFADGITEELISTLSKIRGLKVISRTSAFRYKQTNKSLSEIAKELNVGTVLEGSVRKAADDLRISAQLIDVENDEHLWSQDYDRKFENVFLLQKEIALKVADSLQVMILTEERNKLGTKPTQSLEAYALYLKGRSYRHRMTFDSLKKTIDYCEQAIQKDPNYAQAYAEIARSHAYIGTLELLPSKEAFGRAQNFAERAIELDTTVPESHLAFGEILLRDKWDFRAAETEIRRALEISPNLVDGHLELAQLLIMIRRFDEAALESKRALELDPMSASTLTYAGNSLALARRVEESIEVLRNAVELDPDSAFAHDSLGYAYVLMGMSEKGISEIKTSIDISGGNDVMQKNDTRFCLCQSGKYRRGEERPR